MSSDRSFRTLSLLLQTLAIRRGSERTGVHCGTENTDGVDLILRMLDLPVLTKRKKVSQFIAGELIVKTNQHHIITVEHAQLSWLRDIVGDCRTGSA